MNQQSTPSRVSNSSGSSGVHDRLDDLFDHLKIALRMVDSEELVGLLEEVADSRMVARYGHGMRPCRNSEFRHRHESRGQPQGEQTAETWTVIREPVKQRTSLRTQGGRTVTQTKDNARQIVMNAVTGALTQTRGSEKRQESQGAKVVSSTSKGQNVTGARNAGRGNVLSRLTRQSGKYERVTQVSNVRPPKGVEASTNRDNLAMETILAGELDSNRSFALRREARGSLARYANAYKVEALLSAMPFDEEDEEDYFYDAQECQVPFQSSVSSNTPKSKTGEECPYLRMEVKQRSRNSIPRCWSPTKIDDRDSECESIYEMASSTNDTYSQRSQFNRSAGKFSTAGKQANAVLMGVFHSVKRQMPKEDPFPIEPTTPCKGFRRILPPRVLKHGKSNRNEDPRIPPKDQPEREPTSDKSFSDQGNDVSTSPTNGRTSSDEDVWWNANDRFSTSSIKVKSSIEPTDKQQSEDFLPVKFSSDEKRKAVLINQRQSVKHSTGPSKDTNLIYTVNRTLRESLPKFTGSIERTRGLMHIVNSVLHSDEMNEDDSPDISYAELQELKGEDTHDFWLSSGDVSANAAAKKYVLPRRTEAKIQTETVGTNTRGALQGQLNHQRTTTHGHSSGVGRSQQEILKVLKDSKQNIKVELTMTKEDHPKLAEFVSRFIDSQREGKSSQVTEAVTQTYGCLQCGRNLNTESQESIGDRMTTNNNRSSIPCSPIRTPSPPSKSVSSDLFAKAVSSTASAGRSNASNSSTLLEISQPASKSSSAESQQTSDHTETPRTTTPVPENRSETPRSVSPDPDNQSEGYVSEREGDVVNFNVSEFLDRNNVYRNSRAANEPSRKRSSGFETRLDKPRADTRYMRTSRQSGTYTRGPNKGKDVTHKGSFLGDMCGCN